MPETVNISIDNHIHANKTSLDHITITEVDFDSSTSIVIPAKKCLEKIIIWVDSTGTVSVGDTDGGVEHMNETVFAGDDGYILSLDLFSVAGRTIYVTGGTGLHIKYYIA